MKLDKGQVAALLILFFLAVAVIGLLRNQALQLFKIEADRIVMPSE